jgi:PGF-pre-PGF domain-containing protein
LSSDGSRALVGAINNDTVGADAGATYIFDKPPGGWSGTTSASAATATFLAGAAGDQLGSSVSLSSDGSRALVGAINNATAGASAGAAYIFDKPSGGWSGTTSASAAATTFTGGAANDYFGIVSLSSDGSRALAGSIYNDTAGSNAGAAYLFQSPFASLTAGGTTSGAAGATVNGLTLNPSGTLTNIDLYLGTDASTTTGTAIKTGIATLPASTATTVDGVNLAGKSAGSYYLITCGAGTTTILSATGTAAYTVTGSPPVTTAPAPSTGSSDSPGPAPANTQTVPTSTVSVNVGGNTPVTSVVVTGTGNSGIIVTATEVPASGLGEQPPQSIVYKCLEITPARYGTITGAVITFTVPQSWLEEHRLTPKDIVLYHIVGNEWQALPTTVVKTANGQVYFSAASPGFSRFVIAGITSGLVQTTVTLDPAGVQTSGNGTGIYGPGSSVTPGQAPVQSPVVTRTTAAPMAPAVPNTGFPLATIALIGAGCVVLAGAGWYIHRWWIRQQNPALFKE